MSHAVWEPRVHGEAAGEKFVESSSRDKIPDGLSTMQGCAGTAGKGAPLSADEFVQGLSRLRCFANWWGANLLPPRETPEREMAAEGWAMQQAFIYVLNPLSSAKDSSQLAMGVKRVAEFLNGDSWFGEYDPFPKEPPITWKFEPRVQSNRKSAGWRLKFEASNTRGYSVILTVVAEAALRGNLMDLKRCALDECRRFFVLKKQPGTRATFCTESCRVKYYNDKRITEKRVEDKYKQMLFLARKKVPLTEDQARKVEKFMGMEEFEKFRAALRSGISRPKLSAETRARFAQPRPRGGAHSQANYSKVMAK